MALAFVERLHYKLLPCLLSYIHEARLKVVSFNPVRGQRCCFLIGILSSSACFSLCLNNASSTRISYRRTCTVLWPKKLTMQATFRRYVPERRKRNFRDFFLSLLSFCLGQLIEVQAEYHRKSLELLQSILPQIKAHQGEFCSLHSLVLVARRHGNGRWLPLEKVKDSVLRFCRHNGKKSSFNNHQRFSEEHFSRLTLRKFPQMLALSLMCRPKGGSDILCPCRVLYVLYHHPAELNLHPPAAPLILL